MSWPNRGSSPRLLGVKGVGNAVSVIVPVGMTYSGVQWYRNGVAISGAEGAANPYIQVAADIPAIGDPPIVLQPVFSGVRYDSANYTNTAINPAVSVNMTAMLDSLTFGLGATDPALYAWPVVAQALQPSTPFVSVQNVAVSGNSTAQALARWDDGGAGTAYDARFSLNVLACLGGTNDSPVANVIPSYRRLREIYRRARTTGYDRVISFTIPSRDNAGGSYSADTLPLNIAIRELFDSDMGADALVDLAADPRMATIASVADTNFYSPDGLHFLNAGYAGIGQLAAPVVHDVIQAPGVRKMAPARWSTFDASPQFTISNGGQTIAWTSAGFATASARTYCGAAAGRYSWQTVLDNVSQRTYVGLCNQAFEPSIWADQSAPTESANAIAYSDASVTYNNVIVAIIGLPNAGSVVQHAVDLDARMYWVRLDGGPWNGNINANPTTGIGGIDVSGLGSGFAYPVGGIFSQGSQVTLQMNAAPPDGYKTFVE